MKTGKRQLVFLMVMILVLPLLVVNGCKKASDEDETAAAVTSAVDGVQLCSDCGQVKGSDLCCKPGQEKCSKCGLVKGSPGCCKMPK